MINRFACLLSSWTELYKNLNCRFCWYKNTGGVITTKNACWTNYIRGWRDRSWNTPASKFNSSFLDACCETSATIHSREYYIADIMWCKSLWEFESKLHCRCHVLQNPLRGQAGKKRKASRSRSRRANFDFKSDDTFYQNLTRWCNC